jgi:DNA-binding winged helix-turn-helix (wHTH) protein
LSDEVLVSIAEMSIDRIRKAIRSNRISFPSQTPIFPRQLRSDIQWRLVELFFIHNWSSKDLGARYGLSTGFVRKLISLWVRRASELQYLQEIPATPMGTPPEERHVGPKPPDAVTATIVTQVNRLRRISLGQVMIDLQTHRIRCSGREMGLTPTEWSILAKLVARVNCSVPRSELVKAFVGPPPMDTRGSLRQIIENLRRKLEPDSAHPRYLITQRAIGYRLQTREQL